MGFKGQVKEGLALFLLLTGGIWGQDLEELIKEYEEAAELSRKTKKESLGHLILFTRKDLDRLQARKLSDLLKHIRLITVSNNNFGILTINEFGNYTPIPKNIRLYINNHEVSSLHTGSPFLVWENFSLDNVDHVEIYQSPGAIELGNDPATVIIKIYTKTPERENASGINLGSTSRSGYDANFFSAVEVSPDFSYLFFLGSGRDGRKWFKLGGEDLRRDADYRYAFLGMYFENTSLELGYGFVRRAPFIGFARDGSAEDGYTEAQDAYLVLTSYPFGDQDTKFVFSFDHNKRRHYERSDTGLFIPIFMSLNPLNNPADFFERAVFNKVDIYLSKTLRFSKNSLLTATSYKLYNATIEERRYVTLGGSTVNVDQTVPFSRQEVFSLIVENKLSLSPRNLIITGLKIDSYERNGGLKDFKEWIGRLGFISIPRNDLYLKAFLSRSYIPPFFYDVEISKRDLNPVQIPISATVEGSYRTQIMKLTLWGGYMRVEGDILPDGAGILTNASDPLEVRFASADARFDFGSALLEGGYSFLIDPQRESSPTRGSYLRVSGNLWRLDLFSELVYRGSFTSRNKTVREGYDLSAGASLTPLKDLRISLKGENLLGTATEIPYFIPQSGEVATFPVRGRTYYLNVDWVF